MDAAAALAAWLPGATPLLAVALLVRIASGVEVAAPVLLPTVELKTRLGLALCMTLAALPAALPASFLGGANQAAGPMTAGGALAAIAGEGVIGCGYGLAVAALVSAVAWAGDILGTVAGLAWQDDGEEEAADTPAGIARLARWVSLTAFLSAGGLEAVVAGFVDGVRTVPVGVLSHGASSSTALESLVPSVVATAIGLAVTLAIPAMVAVLAFQLAATIGLRVAACDPGPGVLHGATALVLLATIVIAAPGWSLAAGERLVPTLSATFAARPIGTIPATTRASGERR